jgi:hypothetical protein
VAPITRPLGLRWLPAPAPAPARIHIFVSPFAGQDYLRRLCAAAERHFGTLGTIVYSAAG